MRQPKWKASYRVERLEPDLVFLLSERGHHVLSGRTYYEMAPYLDGQHSVGEIVKQVNGSSNFMHISQALARIQKKGYVVDAQEELPADIAFLCHTLEIDTAVARQRLEQTAIQIKALNGLNGTALTERLRQVGVQVTDSDDTAALEVVLADDYLAPELAAYNQTRLADGRPWLLVQPVGTVLQIGPLFQPGESGCWACLSQRLRLHRRVENFLQNRRGEKNGILPVPLSSFSPLMEIGINWTVIELLKWILTGENENLSQNLTTIDIHTREMKPHRFVRRPQCELCGDGEMIAQRALQPITLQSRPKLFTVDGGHRIRPPEETVAAFEHHISRVTGIIGWLQPALSDNNLIHTYFSDICVLSNPSTYEGLKSEIRHGSAGGKGASPSQGQASGLCEALERYSASYHGNEYAITSSYNALADKAIHPNKCMNYSSLQYQYAEQWNNAPRATRSTYVPPQFDESAEIDWTPVWSLTEQTFKYLPTTYCYFGARNSTDKPIYALADSNGNAAGNTLEEAILQGFMELVERDSIGIWWYNRIQRPAVDIDSFNNDYVAQLRAFFQAHYRDLWVIDISNDLNIPVFAAVSRRNDKPREDIIYGYGAHFDPHIALLRAVTEVCQSFSMFLLAGYGDTLPSYNPQAEYWWHTATIANQPHLAPHPDLPPRKFTDYPRQWREDLRDDVTACVNLVQNLGMETLVLDQTQPDVGLHVVKVFVPGLRHDWRRTGPGRLYDVPVKMGWLDKPLSEEALNPYSIYF